MVDIRTIEDDDDIRVLDQGNGSPVEGPRTGKALSSIYRSVPGTVRSSDNLIESAETNPLEVQREAEKTIKEVSSRLQFLQQRKAQAEANDPRNWTTDQFKDYFKDNPPQNPQEEAQRDYFLKQKNQQVKTIQEQIEELETGERLLRSIQPGFYEDIGLTRPPTRKEQARMDSLMRKREWDLLPPTRKGEVLLEKITGKALPFLITAPAAGVIWPWMAGFELLQGTKNVAVPLAKGEDPSSLSLLEDRHATELLEPLLEQIPEKGKQDIPEVPPSILASNPLLAATYSAAKWAVENPRDAVSLGANVGEVILDYMIVKKGMDVASDIKALGDPRLEEAYKTLGLSPKATTKQAETAYKNLALRHHPDRGGRAEDLAKINDAVKTVRAYRNNLIKRVTDYFRGGEASQSAKRFITSQSGQAKFPLPKKFELPDVKKEEAVSIIISKLPKVLAGAKPRYGYKSNNYSLKFESDLDKAAFITAQKKKSGRDQEYMQFVQERTGWDEKTVREYGDHVKNNIKQLAKLEPAEEVIQVESGLRPLVEPVQEASKAQGTSVISYVKDGKKIYTELTKEELAGLVDEVKNIPTPPKGESQIHLDADTSNLRKAGKKVSREEFIAGHSQAGQILAGSGQKTPETLPSAQTQAPPLNEPAKPETAPPAPAEPTGTPSEPTVPAGKERKFIETVREAEKTAPEVAEAIEGRHTPISNQETIDKARQYIETNYNEAVDLVMGPRRADTFHNAVAIALIDKAQLEGRFADAIQLVNRTAAKQTELGQAIQALAMYERLTPEGILQMAAGQVRKARDSFKSKKPKKLELFDKLSKGLNEKDTEELAKKLKVPHISETVAQELRAMAENIQLMEPGREKSIQQALLLQRVSRLIPPEFGKKLAMIQTMAQLLNPKTFVRNILGNVGFQISENISDAVATAIDIATALRTGERTVFLPDAKTQIEGLGKGLKEGTEEALLGINLRETQSKFTLPKNGVFDKGVMGALEKALRLSLSATDRAFYQSAFNQSIRNQMLAAKRMGKSVESPTEEMIERAHHLGLYRTFQDDSVLSNVFVKIKKVLNEMNGIVGIESRDFGLGDMVIKYPKTPANIMSRGVEYSPLGFANTIKHLTRPLTGAEFDQEEFVRSTSRALTGTGLLVGTGAILAYLGIITGRRHGDRDLQRTKEQVGMGDYRINVSALKRFGMSGMDPDTAQTREDDVFVSYDWMLPSSMGLALGANMVLNPKGNKVDQAMNLGESLLAASDTLQEQPLVQGLRVLSRRENIAEGLSDVIQGIPASFVPTFLNQIRQLTDNTARNTKDPNYFKEAYNRTVLRVPGLSKQLEPKVTTLGEEKEMYQLGSNNPFNVFLNPAFVSKYKPDPVSQMVLEIWEHSGETVQFPRVVSGKVKLGSQTPEPMELTASQYTDYQKYVGRKTDILFTVLAENEGFRSLSPDEQAGKLQKYLTDINTSAKIELFGYEPKRVSKDVMTILRDIGINAREIRRNEEVNDPIRTAPEDDEIRTIDDGEPLRTIGE